MIIVAVGLNMFHSPPKKYLLYEGNLFAVVKCSITVALSITFKYLLESVLFVENEKLHFRHIQEISR